MRHWVKLDQSGAHSFVRSQDDTHPTDHGEPKKGFTYVPLDRAPGEHEYFDGKGLRTDHASRLQSERAARINAMSREQFIEHVLALVDERLSEQTKETAR